MEDVEGDGVAEAVEDVEGDGVAGGVRIVWVGAGFLNECTTFWTEINTRFNLSFLLASASRSKSFLSRSPIAFLHASVCASSP